MTKEKTTKADDIVAIARAAGGFLEYDGG